MKLNRATVVVNKLFNHYMINKDSDIAGEFCIDYITNGKEDWSLLTAENTYYDLNHFLRDEYESLNDADPLDPFGHRLYRNYHKDKKIIQKNKQMLRNNLLSDEYVLYNKYTKCQPLKLSNMELIKRCMKTYLINYMTPEFKIKWVLKHHKKSDRQLAKSMGLFPQQILYYKKGQRDIDRMSLGSAKKFGNYYNFLINSQLS